jgi:hypothetical protein
MSWLLLFPLMNRFVDFVNVPAFSFDSQGKAVRHPARLHGISDMENMVSSDAAPAPDTSLSM